MLTTLQPSIRRGEIIGNRACEPVKEFPMNRKGAIRHHEKTEPIGRVVAARAVSKRDRAELIAEAHGAFALAENAARVLETFARSLADHVCTWCVVDWFGLSGSAEPVAFAH